VGGEGMAEGMRGNIFVDIINYREGFTDKLQYFTLFTEFVLITFF
jgi:hypothetical protein